MKYMCLTCRQLAGNLPVNKKCPAVLKAHGRAFAVKKNQKSSDGETPFVALYPLGSDELAQAHLLERRFESVTRVITRKRNAKYVT